MLTHAVYQRLIAHLQELDGINAIGGEGLNEIIMQNQSFAQTHIFESFGASIDGLERCGGCDLNAFMFGRLCRAIGYTRLDGSDEDQCLRARIHEERRYSNHYGERDGGDREP